eukprot:TRINITY_DN1674_c0_g1_i2.p1 TRINITY_DN1674_c0_g1~~TRINITY_DN1674_c0_g1_i2.p1  ORF type:complete len:216 (-),score=47.38 TRINITY_DN1674_c0_g1_i2:51-641(-)
MAATTPKQRKFYRVAMIGDPGVGKTSLFSRLTEGEFPTTPEDFIAESKALDYTTSSSRSLQFLFHDTAGQERFRHVTSSYFRTLNLALLVYDVSDENSYSHIKFWSGEVARYAPGSVGTLVIANKTDLENRAVTTERGQELAEEMSAGYLELSAKTTENYDNVYETMAKIVFSKEVVNDPVANDRPREQTGCCCIV